MSKWGGSLTRAARAYFTPLIEAGGIICPKCQLEVHPDQRWQVGHQEDQALGGGHELHNLYPEHGTCNESAGGRLGHALKQRTPPPKVKRRDWTSQ